MSDIRNPSNWPQTSIEMVINQLTGDLPTPHWTDVLALIIDDEINNATQAQLAADVSTERGRAAFYEAKGRRDFLVNRFRNPVQLVLQTLEKAQERA